MARNKNWNPVTRRIAFFNPIKVADACRRASHIFFLDGSVEQADRFSSLAEDVERGYCPAKDAATDLLYELERSDFSDEKY